MEREPVELVWREGGASLNAAREALHEGLTAAGLNTEWTEWNADDAHAPRYARCTSYPAVFVNGVRVDGFAPAALRRASKRRRPSWWLTSGLTPAFALALLPKCPFCWAGYGAVAFSLGLQVDTSYVWLVATLCIVVIAGAACLWRLESRLGAATATLGAGVVIASRWFEGGPLFAYGGVALLCAGFLIALSRASLSTPTARAARSADRRPSWTDA